MNLKEQLTHLYTRLNRRKNPRAVGLLVFVFGVTISFFIAPNITLAQNTPWLSMDTFAAIPAHMAMYGLSIMSGLLGISATLLNISLMFTVVDMGHYINDIVGINIAWSLLRDVSNIIFIFAIVYIGISLILGIDRSGHRQALARLVIAALLINFSLFAAKAVVEVSNIVAREVYVLISPDTGECNIGSVQRLNGDCLNYGLSGVMMRTLGLASLFEIGTRTGDPTSTWGTPGITYEKIIYLSVIGSVFLLITSFVFASAAVLIMIRFVMLILLMVFSPLAFAAWVLPATRAYFSKWLSALLNQSFFAPLYLFMMWIAVKIIETYGISTVTGVQSGVGNAGFAAALLNESVGFSTVFLNFGLITVFMVAALFVAKSVGGIGADRALGMLHSGVKRAGSYAYRRKGLIAAAAITGGVGGVAAGALGLGAYVGGKRVLRGSVGGTADYVDKKLAKYAPGTIGQSIRSTITKPLKDKATFGTGASYSQKTKEYEQNFDETLKKMTDRGDYSGALDILDKSRDASGLLSPSLSAQFARVANSLSEQQKGGMLEEIEKRRKGASAKKSIGLDNTESSLITSLKGDTREKTINNHVKRLSYDMTMVNKFLNRKGITQADRESAYESLSDKNRAAFEEVLRNKTRKEGVVSYLNDELKKKQESHAQLVAANPSQNDVRISATELEVIESKIKKVDTENDPYKIIAMVPSDVRQNIESALVKNAESQITDYRNTLSDEDREKTRDASDKAIRAFKRKGSRSALAELINSGGVSAEKDVDDLLGEMSPAEIVPFMRANPAAFSSDIFAKKVKSRFLDKLTIDEDVENSAVEKLVMRADELGNGEAQKWLTSQHNQVARVIKDKIDKKRGVQQTPNTTGRGQQSAPPNAVGWPSMRNQNTAPRLIPPPQPPTTT